MLLTEAGGCAHPALSKEMMDMLARSNRTRLGLDTQRSCRECSILCSFTIEMIEYSVDCIFKYFV